MAGVTVRVIISGEGWEVEDTETGVRLNDDDVQVSAAGLAYGLVEKAWGELPDED